MLSTAVFTVEPEEEGVVLRFGQFQRTVEPGLHIKMPYPVESVFKVPTQRQLKEEFGFRTVRPDVPHRICHGPPHRREAHAHGRPQRGLGRVDRPIPRERPLQLSVQGPQRAEHVSET